MLAILKESYDVKLAISLNGARDLLEDYPINLILLDLSLQGDEDGLSLVRATKADPMMRDIPVIAVTANAYAHDRDHAIASGCNDFIAKPIDRKMLLHKIENLISEKDSTLI